MGDKFDTLLLHQLLTLVECLHRKAGAWLVSNSLITELLILRNLPRIGIKLLMQAGHRYPCAVS